MDLLIADEVVGSNKKEFFHVRRQADGTVQVTLYDLTPQGEVDSTKVYYNRTFYPAETKEIRLFGLAGDDRFLIEGQAEHSILVRIINNEGHGRFDGVISAYGCCVEPKPTPVIQNVNWLGTKAHSSQLRR